MLNIKLTNDPFQAGYREHYTEEIQRKLEDTIHQLEKDKPQLLSKLLKLVKKYPRLPDFKDLLAAYYVAHDQIDKAITINHRIIKEHPNYVYAKINLAKIYLDVERYEEVPKILGETLDLQALYPERKAFLYPEFEEFMYAVSRFFILTENIDTAETCINFLEERIPDSDYLDYLWKGLEIYREFAEAVISHHHVDFWEEGEPFGRSYDKSIQTKKPPKLQHPELKVLYDYGLRIPKETLQNILSLPRESLIADLKAILWDSVCRHEYFYEDFEFDDENDDYLHFPLHAMFLLTELRAKEALPLLLDCLRQGEEYLEFWYNDHLFETLWHFYYHLGQDQLDVFQSFMHERDIHYHGKALLSTVVKQIALHQKKRLPEVYSWYENVLVYYLDHPEDEDLIDLDAISFLIADLPDLPDLPDRERFIPLIEKFYDLGLVNETALGVYEEIEWQILEHKPESIYSKDLKEEIFDNIFDHYNQILTTWDFYLTKEDQKAKVDLFRKQFEGFENKLAIQQGSKPSSLKPFKISRNAPCPCGSGKKYKQCCWGKQI
ncbi:MAG: hypothetical protein DHS20C18_14020 [Saprospiraceae bacterium]|nr:MAG: hypothetical protein DHS20C18_14020 [Saprospiraceae bacterium]